MNTELVVPEALPRLFNRYSVPKVFRDMYLDMHADMCMDMCWEMTTHMSVCFVL